MSLKTGVRQRHCFENQITPHRPFFDAFSHPKPLQWMALVLCAQLQFGCGGGGATGQDAATDSYTCSHFVDSAGGADANSGTSPESAWESADRAASHTRSTQVRAGDTICFKRGQRYVIAEGQLGASGSSDAPVIIGAYGDPAETAPRLSPAIRIDDSPEWISLGNGVIYWPKSHASWNVSGLWRNGVWLRAASDQFLRDGDWHFRAGDGVYLRQPARSADSGPVHLAIKHSIFGVHRLQHVVFQDLIFEYAGAAIAGRPSPPGGLEPPRAIGHITVRNCRFEHLTAGVYLTSETINGRLYENHNISITGNRFNDIRFAVRLDASGNGSERHRYVTITGNVVRNVSVNGSYAGDKNPDIETIRMQNPTDTHIADNIVETGLRLAHGSVNVDGERLYSSGIVLWRNPASVMSRVRVERNFINDMEHGIIVGSGVEDAMRQVIIMNNIVSNCDTGLKMNGAGAAGSYHARYNTLYRNNVNLSVAGGGQTLVNNFSVQPRAYHIVFAGANEGLSLDYNAYVPDGSFLLRNTFDPALDLALDGLAVFQATRINGQAHDGHSRAAGDAGFLTASPLAPEDYRITESSVARKRGVVSGQEDVDFARRARQAENGMDIGAWARYPADG